MLFFHEDEIARNSLLDSICRVKFFSLLGSELLVVMMPRNWPKYEYWCNILTCAIFHHLMRANVNTFPIPVCPMGCAVHAKLCTVQSLPGHTQMAIPFAFAPHVYLKTVANQNVTPVIFTNEIELVAPCSLHHMETSAV